MNIPLADPDDAEARNRIEVLTLTRCDTGGLSWLVPRGEPAGPVDGAATADLVEPEEGRTRRLEDYGGRYGGHYRAGPAPGEMPPRPSPTTQPRTRMMVGVDPAGDGEPVMVAVEFADDGSIASVR